MTPAPRPPSAVPTRRRLAAAGWLFAILLGGLGARPLTGESFVSAELSFLSSVSEVSSAGPRPSATAALDSLLLLSSALTFLLPRPPHRTPRGYWLAAATLIAAVGFSAWAASDRSAALIAGGHLATVVIVAAALRRLLHGTWMVRIALAALLASGGTLALKCLLQVSGEFAQTREFWEREQRPALEKAGVDLTHPTIVNYERRLASNEAFGFLTLSNVAASCLMMPLLPLLGLLVGSFAGSGPPGRARSDAWAVRMVLTLAAIVLATALGFTGSTGAFAATLVGLGALGVFSVAGAWFARRALFVTLLGAALYFAAIAAAGAYGRAAGTLPHPSLAFRWHYWSTVPAAIHDAWPTGLGRENFQAAYLRHKPVESPEETRDPHNLWLSLLIELGPLGLLASAALLGAVVVLAIRALGPPATLDETVPDPARGAAAVSTAAAVAAAFLLIHGCLSGAFFGAEHVIAWVMQVGAVWPIGFAVFCGLLRPASYGAVDTRFVAAGLAAGVIAALTHALVDFALLTPAGLALFVGFAVLVIRRPAPDVTAPHPAPGPPPGRPAAWLTTALLACFGLHAAFVTIPQLAAENARDELRRALSRARGIEAAEAAVQRAAQALDRDRLGDLLPRALVAAARQLARACAGEPPRQLTWLQHAAEWATEWRRRNPLALGPRQEQAAIHTELADVFALLGREEDERRAARAAAEFAAEAVAAYPTSPRLRITAGIAWYEVWRLSHDPRDAQQATTHFRTAIEIDERRPPEEVVRLRAAERRTIADHLDWLAAASQPASQPAAGRN